MTVFSSWATTEGRKETWNLVVLRPVNQDCYIIQGEDDHRCHWFGSSLRKNDTLLLYKKNTERKRSHSQWPFSVCLCVACFDLIPYVPSQSVLQQNTFYLSVVFSIVLSPRELMTQPLATLVNRIQFYFCFEVLKNTDNDIQYAVYSHIHVGRRMPSTNVHFLIEPASFLNTVVCLQWLRLDCGLYRFYVCILWKTWLIFGNFVLSYKSELLWRKLHLVKEIIVSVVAYILCKWSKLWYSYSHFKDLCEYCFNH